MRSKFHKKIHQIHPPKAIWHQPMESSLSKNILQAWEMANLTTQHPHSCASSVERTITPNHTARNTMFSALTARVRNMHPAVVYTSQELHIQQMVRHQTLLTPVGEATEHSHQLCLTSRKRSLKTKIDQGRNNNNRTWVPMQPHPLKDSILTHHPTRWLCVPTSTTIAAGSSVQPNCHATGPQCCCCTPTDGPAPSATLEDQSKPDKCS